METILKLNKFSDIYKAIKSKENKEKGDVFEILTKYIFLVHPNYINFTKNIWLYDDIPDKIKKQFKLPDKDKGIDLLLESNDDEYFAIQCKYRSNSNDKVTWTELSTFAGQLFVGKFKKAMFVTNTYDVDEEIHKCDNIQCLYGDFFKDDMLNKEFFDNIRNLNKKKKIVYEKKELFDYQKKAVNKCVG